MTLWPRLRALARRLGRRGSWECALHDELQAYLGHEIDARIKAGMAPAEARRTALADFGGVEQVKEQVRGNATGVWFDSIRQDLRYAWRALAQSRAYTAWVVGSLAMGMTVTIAALALLNASILLPFPGVREQHRLARVAVSQNCGQPHCWSRMATSRDYEILREGLASLQGLAAYTGAEIAVGVPDARSMYSVFTSPNYFEVLGVRPATGRVFDAVDTETHAAVAVIAHRVWTREFDGDPSVIGRSIRIADRFVQIVGVAPAYFAAIDRARHGGTRSMEVWAGPDIWLPMWLAGDVLPLTAAERPRQEPTFSFVGRLQDVADARQLQAEAKVLALRLVESRGQAAVAVRADVGRVWRVNPRTWRFGLFVIMPIPILILIVACVNAATLTLLRGSQRQREMALRLAIGAGRARIVRQLLVESGLLAVLATVMAVPLAWWSLQLVSSPLNIPIPLDPTVLGWTLLTAAVTTVTFGLVPAFRVSAQEPSSTLGPVGTRGDAVPRQSLLRRLMVIAQLALSLGLLATGSQLVTTVRAQAVSGGTPADRLLLARFHVPPDTGEAERFYRDVAEGALRLPGAEAVGVARHTSVWTFGQGPAPASLVVWAPTADSDDGRTIIGGYAGGDLFAAVGLRTVAGRGFTDADRLRRPQVAIVNQTAAKSINGPAVGSLLRVAPRGRDFNSSIEVRVVGVIEPALEPRLEEGDPPAAKIYLPSPVEAEPALTIYVRTRHDATMLAQPVRELVSRIAPRVPVLEIGSLGEFNERSYAMQLWLARAAAVLGVIGLLLATMGMYGVSSYVVAMRSREMAIRMAVGAQPRTILAMVLSQSMRVALIGLLVGGGMAVAASRVIQAGYHGIRGIDVWVFGGAMALFLAAMSLASAIPAARASRLDVVANLRDG